MSSTCIITVMSIVVAVSLIQEMNAFIIIHPNKNNHRSTRSENVNFLFSSLFSGISNTKLHLSTAGANEMNGESQGASKAEASTTTSSSLSTPTPQEPTLFREAEVLGLRLMQEGQFAEALKVFQKGLKLPGSRTDIIRTKMISGPSPVGGASGGTDGKLLQTLDEFELQAAHYNIACAYSRLGKIDECCSSLENAFISGFDNYETVRADPDLSSVHDAMEFENLMEQYDSKRGIFGFFK